jgi:hypothetical protein
MKIELSVVLTELPENFSDEERIKEALKISIESALGRAINDLNEQSSNQYIISPADGENLTFFHCNPEVDPNCGTVPTISGTMQVELYINSAE